jgi:hypothetical protein
MDKDDDPRLMDEFTPVARKAWKTLKSIVQVALEFNMPAMKNFEEGSRLADYLLDGKPMVSEPPLEFVKLSWAERLVDQLDGVRERCFQLHSKSVGGILALQEQIAAAWHQSRNPVEAALVGEMIEALPADIIEAESVPPEEILEAEVLDEPVEESVAPPPIPPAVQPVVEAPASPLPSRPVIAPEEFSLDLDVPPPKSAEPEPPSFDGTVPQLVPTPIHGETILKPAKNGRPPLKITYIRGNEKSPLAG